MQLTLAIDSAIASAKLWALMLRIRDPAKLHKIWGVRQNERRYGYLPSLVGWRAVCYITLRNDR